MLVRVGAGARDKAAPRVPLTAAVVAALVPLVALATTPQLAAAVLAVALASLPPLGAAVSWCIRSTAPRRLTACLRSRHLKSER